VSGARRARAPRNLTARGMLARACCSVGRPRAAPPKPCQRRVDARRTGPPRPLASHPATNTHARAACAPHKL
jgi:hypothetical protein